MKLHMYIEKKTEQCTDNATDHVTLLISATFIFSEDVEET